MDALNGNRSYDQINDKYTNVTTATSLKSSLASMFRASLSNPKFSKGLSMSGVKSEDLSIEIVEENIDEYSEPKVIKNFQKNYLELGQWPEVQAQVFQKFKGKYRKMKKTLEDCKKESKNLSLQVEKHKKGLYPCVSCKNINEESIKTKSALEEAVKLSSKLLKELKEKDCKFEF
jgi:hypothetical protein